MNNVCKEIFKAVHEGKWLSIEYKNQEDKVTRYWIGIKNINVERRTLLVEGLHLANYTLKELTIYIDSILSASIIDGSYYAVNNKLVENIKTYPTKYKELFSNVVNIKILNYLADCNRMDTTPYRSDYALLEHFDEDCLITGSYKLTKWISNTSNDGDACAFIGRKTYWFEFRGRDFRAEICKGKFGRN